MVESSRIPLSLSLDLSLVSLRDTLLWVIMVSDCCWLLVSADTVLVSLMLLPLHSVLGSTESREPSECPDR